RDDTTSMPSRTPSASNARFGRAGKERIFVRLRDRPTKTRPPSVAAAPSCAVKKIVQSLIVAACITGRVSSGCSDPKHNIHSPTAPPTLLIGSIRWESLDLIAGHLLLLVHVNVERSRLDGVGSAPKSG